MSGLQPLPAVSSEDSRAPLLEVCALRRSFGETQALRACSLVVYPGEIHAVVGENGSGKSTLVKILSGVLRPDGGALHAFGQATVFNNPSQSRRAGIATVFQETLVIDELSVRENLFVGSDGLFRRHPDRGRETEIARKMLALLGLEELDLEQPIWELTLAQRQLVTIVRALVRPWKLLILDEPTSALDIEDREHLFAVLADARTRGASVLFISHRMDEVQRIADRVTVLRSGESVDTLDARDAPTDLLLQMMSSAARDVGRRPLVRPAQAGETAAVVRARGVGLREGRGSFDVEIRAGEILGIAGLEGHGQDRFLDCLAGLAAPASGVIEISQSGGFEPVRNPHDAFRKGIAYVPRSRKDEGIFPSLSVLDNLMMPVLRRFSLGGLLRWRALVRAGERAISDMSVKTPSLSASIVQLSGGNQQKVLVGRWIETQPRVLALNDPMRGVDLGAKLDLYEVFRRMASAGMTLVFLSTEIEELVLLADRVAVFRDQSLWCMLERDEIGQDSIIAAMFGQRGRA